MRVVWINKSPWRKDGPIVYMGLLNAAAFAGNGIATDYFVGAGEASDTADDLEHYYGVTPPAELAIHRVIERGGQRRDVYRAALAHVAALCAAGEKVVVLTRELGCLAALLRLRARYPALRVLHEAHDYFLSTRHLVRRNVATWRRQWAERWLLPRCDGMILLTDYQRALYQQWLPELPMRALPLGALAFPPARDDEARRALRHVAYVGHLHEAKGLDKVFAIATRLDECRAKLTCFGGTPRQAEALRRRALEHGVADALDFVSFMSPRQLHAILAAEISLGIVPLADTYYNRYLTCPVKALDGIAHGLPVVASDLPGVREVLREAGCYANVRADDMAERILGLLDDASTYATAAAASRRRREQLRWTTRATSIVEFVEQIG